VLATGSDLVIAAVVGPALTLLLDRRLPPIKLFFNLGQFALSVCLATLICSWLAPVGTDWGPRLAIAVLVGAQVSATTCVALIGAAISLSEGWLGLRQLTRMFATDLTVTVTNSSLGLVAALIVDFARREPSILFAFLLLFAITEVGIYMLVALLEVATPLGRSAWQIMAGNLLAALVMGTFFWRRHHELADEFRHSLDDPPPSYPPAPYSSAGAPLAPPVMTSTRSEGADGTGLG
jgi:hypothetical protein